MLEIKEKYADDRRTYIDMSAIDFIDDESLIPVENMFLTLTNKGYIKRVPIDTYKTQNRGGVGIKGMSTNEEDFVEYILNATTHDYILFFTSNGRVFRMKGYEIPEYSRQSKGLPLVNFIKLENGEKVTSLLKTTLNEDYKYLIFATKNGLIKKTDISEFLNIRTNGKKAITLKDNDELVSVKKTTGENEILMASSIGRMVRFSENGIRVMGRNASGVKGIDLSGSSLVGMEVVENNQDVFVVTRNGYGKKTPVDEYRITSRGGKGVKTLNVTEKNGPIISFKTVDNENKEQDLLIVTNEGIVIRIKMEQISTMSRVTQGIRLINLRDGQFVSTVSIVDSENEEDNEKDSSLDTNV